MIITESQTKEVTTDVAVAFLCDACDDKIPMFQGSNEPTEGIALGIWGGYGAYFDGRAIQMHFCRACVEKLVQTFPVIDKKMEEAWW